MMVLMKTCVYIATEGTEGSYSWPCRWDDWAKKLSKVVPMLLDGTVLDNN